MKAVEVLVHHSNIVIVQSEIVLD